MVNWRNHTKLDKMDFGHKHLYIDGELVASTDNSTYDLICPGDESIIGSISWAQKADTEKALKVAEQGFKYWSNLPLSERLTWIANLREQLIENSDLLRTSVMYEMGKVWENTAEDITSIVNSLEYYPQEIEKREDLVIPDKEGTHTHKVISQPLGVVVAFLAYNFPLLNLGFKLGPALAAGCSIIIKPSEFSPLSAYIIGELCAKINFPKGVINIICGDVSNVGIPLCESQIPRLITMIGSTETAQKLIAQSSKTSIKRYSMECGGNAPFIVFEDADIEAAIDLGATLKTSNTGQICVAPNRFFIQESVLERFLEGMKERFEQTRIGFGRAHAPQMGPLANRQSVEKIKTIVADAQAQGGEVIFGGQSIDQPGYYFQPTLIRLKDPQAEILQREIFGPVALVVSFSTEEEVLRWANNTSAGLASYVFANNRQTLDYFATGLEFGEVQLNGVKYDIYLPHGGIKNSGIGVDCSTFALDDYLIKKRVSQAIV